jgi:CheY-like chemotaxis protein
MPAPEKLILLVEDSTDDVFVFKRALARTNLKNPVSVAPDVEDAICYLEGVGTYADRSLFPLPSIVIIDLRMPNKDGFHLLEWLHDRPEFWNVNIVVVSGVSRTQEVNRAYKMGASSFLIKPIQEDDLRRLARAYPAYWA